MLPRGDSGSSSGSSISAWIGQVLASCMGGCLGCCSKPNPIIAVDEPSKGLKIQGRTVKPSISEDFWSTSSYEMDDGGVQSQRSISSISTSTQMHDLHGSGSSSNPSEFVNHGRLLWNQTRQQWLGKRRPETCAQKVREPRLSWNATYDTLLGSNKPFPQPIPLSVGLYTPDKLDLEPKRNVKRVIVVFLLNGNGRCLVAGDGRFPRGCLGAGGHARLALQTGSSVIWVPLDVVLGLVFVEWGCSVCDVDTATYVRLKENTHTHAHTHTHTPAWCGGGAAFIHTKRGMHVVSYSCCEP